MVEAKNKNKKYEFIRTKIKKKTYMNDTDEKKTHGLKEKMTFLDK